MKKILFVLGAGASVEVGFPTGRQLSELIGNLIRSPNSASHRTLMQLFPQDLVRKEMLERLYYAELPTIDDLLTAYKEDADFVRFGKTVIAAVLCGIEDQNRMFPMPQGHWYRQLRNHLRAHPAAITNRSISFLTFNYDRSLEHYIEKALVHSNNPPEEVHQFLGRENFIHAHGQLGFLPWQSSVEPFRPYKHEFDKDSLELAASGIKLPYEEGSETDARITKLLGAADIVCICGFGFHEANVNRAQLKSVIGSKTMVLTKTGMTPQAFDEINAQFRPSNAFASIHDCLSQVLDLSLR